MAFLASNTGLGEGTLKALRCARATFSGHVRAPRWRQELRSTQEEEKGQERVPYGLQETPNRTGQVRRPGDERRKLHRSLWPLLLLVHCVVCGVRLVRGRHPGDEDL